MEEEGEKDGRTSCEISLWSSEVAETHAGNGLTSESWRMLEEAAERRLTNASHAKISDRREDWSSDRSALLSACSISHASSASHAPQDGRESPKSEGRG